MAETTLIAISDVQVYRQVSASFPTARFDAFCMEIQRTNLRDLFGQALYLDFMADARTSGKYKDLLDGKDYVYANETIKYYGLKPMLVYWWLAIAARESDLFIANVGAIQLVNNTQQNLETAKEKDRIAVSYSQTAQSYANDVIKFLNTEASTYTFWAAITEKNKSNFLSFKL